MIRPRLLIAALLGLSPLGLSAQGPATTPCVIHVPYLDSHPLQGKARFGDVMMTMRYQYLVLGFHTDTRSYYAFATPQSQELDGLTVRPDVPDHMLYSDEPRHAAGELDSLGAIVNRDFATTPLSPLMGDPKITSYDPISGELFLPNETGFPLFVAPAIGGVARPFTMNPAPGQIIGTAFDPEGNLYLNCGGYGLVLKVSAAEVAKGRAGLTAATTVLASFGQGNTVFGTVADGQGHLFVVRFESGELWRIDTTTGAKQVWAGGLCPGDGLAIGIDGSLWVSQFWCSNGTKGLVNISGVDGSKLGYYPIPSVVDGIAVSGGSYPDDLATFGLPLPFLPPFCMIPSPTPSPTVTATPTFSVSPTATPSNTPSASPSSTRTASPSATPSVSCTATPSASATRTVTPNWTATVTPTPHAPREEDCPPKLEDLVVWPNPWTDHGECQRRRCSVKLPCSVDKLEVDLYSSSGNKVCSFSKAPVEVWKGDWVNLEFPEHLNLPNGTYYCQVRALKGTSSDKRTCNVVVIK